MAARATALQRLDVDIEVRADASQLRQIVWNLCENALKHGVQQSPEQVVELRYGRMSTTARPFLEIADRGPGVAPEQAERIFEPFFSGGRGTGLGLVPGPGARADERGDASLRGALRRR